MKQEEGTAIPASTTDRSTLTLTTVGSTLNTIGLSDEVVTIFTLVVVVVLLQAIDIFGIVSNVINIMCFIKQGFQEPVNISFFGLAICDLGCLVTQMGINVGYTFILGAPNANFEILEITFMVAGIPHLSFSRVNCWITAIITLERCLCVTVPLKVKRIVTPKRSWIIMSCVFIVLLFSGTPMYAASSLGMKFSSERNRTVLGSVPSPGKDKMAGMTLAVNSFLLPFVAFIIIIVCTTILVNNLRQKTQWRKAATQTNLSTREQKVAKMVVMISALFISCFVPVSLNMLAVVFEPRLNVGGQYINISKILGSLGLLLESVNSSANIFIYYHMSKKYRDTFRLMCQRNAAKANAQD